MILLVLYNVMLHLILLCATPYLLVRALYDRGFRPILRRFGLYRADIPAGGLWIHAVSVGEVAAAKPLVLALQRKFPQTPLVLTTSTVTGQDVAKKTLGGHGVAVAFFPFDIPFAVRRALSRIRPRALIILETELWPNIIRKTAARGIPVMLLNGRISASSVKWYRFVVPLVRGALREFDALGVRTRDDACRMERLGAEPSKIAITGNIKFEASLLSISDEQRPELARQIGLRDGERLIVAGSTHAGEEELVVNVFKRLREEVPAAVLLLAPRHVARLDEVCDTVRRAGLEFVLRSDKRSSDEVRQVIVLDTTGELAKLYALGEIAIVGGSFEEGIGGHNALEPAAVGVPVLFGPHMESFAEIVERLRRHGGCIQVKDGEGLYAACCELLGDRERREQMGRNAREAVISGGGALAKSVAMVEDVLRRPRGALS
jgi:3-deoxy-D-manno-octulosonic-acid transferase